MKKNKQHCDLTVIDDFLPEGDFKRLKMIFDNPDFGWFRNDGISGSDATMSTTQSALDNYYFVHLLYLQYRAMSTYFDEVLDIIHDPLKARFGNTFRQLFRLKVNLYPRTEEVQVHPWHVDSKDIQGLMGCLFFMNTCDGYTGFSDGTEVDSVENRIVVFDSTQKHFSTSCSNARYRTTFNINFL